MRVTLAYPYTADDGTAYDPDQTADLPDAEARALVHDGWGRWPSEEPEGPFDPTGRSVKDVDAYLASVDDPTERARVLDLERAGQARKSLVGE